MKKPLKIFLVIIIYLLPLSKTYSHDNVAYINLDYILNNSNIGKKIIEKLKLINDENIEKIKTKENFLKDKEKQLLNEKNILSEETYKKNFNNLRKEINEFRLTKNENNKKFNELKKKEFDKFLGEIEPILNNYMKENSINILLDKKNIFIGKTELDITEKIINIINVNN
mgnify:CR=1 FL=1